MFSMPCELNSSNDIQAWLWSLNILYMDTMLGKEGFVQSDHCNRPSYAQLTCSIRKVDVSVVRAKTA